MSKWLHLCDKHATEWDRKNPLAFPAEDTARCTLAGCARHAILSIMIKEKKRGA